MKQKKQTSLQKLTNKNKPNTQIKQNIFQQILFIDKFKAFLTDIFMIYMPILYIATYFILGSKEAFQQSQITLFICFFLYAIILSILFATKSQTLGYMYAEIILLKDDDRKVGFFLALFRFILFCFSMSLVFGFFVPFMRKDRKTFHDFICKTKVLKHKRIPVK
ncbi:hypothetical protein CCY99_06850 [Helicobacter sp. 16-1353]|uniref:RDD family protein n=1 Tax=Helicobacter sp. 16-1353 TaxID=2004996 RepID=UPI000DCD7FA1|nr:RDD family protein [Helicobacter sp. 16-1353]RAX52685.1 hypothetical protein CCY99_06850 [Helicobacter sp. 16-1353]